MVFHRTLPDELKAKLEQKNLGLDYRPWIGPSRKAATSSTSISAKTGRRISSGCASCRMVGWLKPEGWKNSLSSIGITTAQAKTLVEQGGTLEVNGEVLACQIVNGQPAVARFSAKNYTKAKELVASKGLHLDGCLERSRLQRSGDDAGPCSQGIDRRSIRTESRRL